MNSHKEIVTTQKHEISQDNYAAKNNEISTENLTKAKKHEIA
jgi:hypothetical protein